MRCDSGIYFSVKAVFRKQGQLSGVVNMGVSQKNKIYRAGRNRELIVFVDVRSLLHTAVYQYFFTACLKQCTGACDFMGCAEKSQFHKCLLDYPLPLGVTFLVCLLDGGC